MSNWQQIRLGDVCSFQNGLAFKSNEFDTNGDYYVIKIKELKNGYVKLFNESSKVFKNGKNNIYSIKYNDVLIALTGDPVNKPNPCSWVGRVAVNKNKEQLYLNQRVAKFCPNDNFLDLKFIYYYFRVYDNFYDLAQKATGSASQANISTKTIEDTVIFVPSLNKQKQIVKILSSLDDKIELNNRINANLEEQAQALFRRWFVDFEFPNEQGLPYKSNDGAFVESELGRIPKGWISGKFTDIANIQGGGTPQTKNKKFWNGNIPFFTPKDVPNVCFTLFTEKQITEEGLKNCNSKFYPKYTIFITARGTVGKVVIAGQNMAMNQSCYALVGKDDNIQYFVYYYTKELIYLLRNKASGAVFDAITTRDFDSDNVVIPPKGIIIKFQNNIKPLMALILNNCKENQGLIQLRDTILPRLMNNQIKI